MSQRAAFEGDSRTKERITIPHTARTTRGAMRPQSSDSTTSSSRVLFIGIDQAPRAGWAVAWFIT